MQSILYITDNQTYGRTIQNLMGSNINVDNVDPSKIIGIEGYDIIIYDWDFESGRSLIDICNIRQMCGFKDTPILVSVSESEASDVLKAFTVGANDLITKPFDPEVVIKKLHDSLKPVGTRAEINTEMVNPFLEATIDVIGKMTSGNVERKDLFLKKNYTLFGDVSGVMGISGETNGVVAITFQMDLGYTIVAKMIGCKESDLAPDDVHDGIGELINIISGSAKTALCEVGYGFIISLPTIIMGQGHQISHPSNEPVVVMIFETEGKLFAVQLCISSRKGSSASENENDEIKTCFPASPS